MPLTHPSSRWAMSHATICCLLCPLLGRKSMARPYACCDRVAVPAMERLADRVGAGQPVTSPEWVGLFRVVGSAVDPSTGNVGLIIDPDPSGRSGFVRVSVGPGIPAGRSNGPFHNLNFDLQLRDRWWYECED